MTLRFLLSPDPHFHPEFCPRWFERELLVLLVLFLVQIQDNILDNNALARLSFFLCLIPYLGINHSRICSLS